jgi:hypothetical protein
MPVDGQSIDDDAQSRDSDATRELSRRVIAAEMADKRAALSNPCGGLFAMSRNTSEMISNQLYCPRLQHVELSACITPDQRGISGRRVHELCFPCPRGKFLRC